MNYKLQILMMISLTSFTYAIDTANSHLSSDGIGETYISGQTFTNKKIYYDIQDDLAVFEGDILLGTVDEAEAWRESEEDNTSSEDNNTANAQIINGARYRWPNGVIPYSISANVSSQTRNFISRAMQHISARTAIRFVQRTYNHPNYININSNVNACYSNVGDLQQGAQTVNVVAGCGYGGIIHELTHAIGLWHEQSRIDRNQYVRINWNNIKASAKHNFNQHISDGVDVGHYDYNSLMHYGAYYFSINGQATITPLNGNAHIGQRNGLSQGDIAAINAMYGGGGGGGGNSSALNYEFNSNQNSQGWSYANMIQQYGGPYSGAWFFACNQNDPQLMSPSIDINANSLKKITIRIANMNPWYYSQLQVFWKGNGGGFSESNSQIVNISSHGGWSTYTIDLSSNPRWSGNINQIRIDPITAGDGNWIAIDYIRIH